jgi:NADH-quinone oxidoreductase subunit M
MAGMITLLILIPLLGAVAVSALPRAVTRPLSLICALSGSIATLFLWSRFDPGQAGLQMIERHSWIPAIGAEYFTGVDGISLLFLLLTSIIIPFGLLAGKGDRAFAH